jgi:uncharacterized protein
VTGPTRTIVVTGASDGIGRALAMAFADKDRVTVLLGRNQSRLDAVAEQLANRCKTLTLAVDLTANDAMQRVDDFLTEENLTIDMLINSAGIGLSGPFADAPRDEIDQLVQLNILALTRLTHRALRDMRREKRGSIINLSSLGAYAPGPNQAAYYASKAYVLSFSEALAHEEKPHGISVLAVVPGPVRTNFHARMGTLGAWYLKLMPTPSPATVAQYVKIAHALGLRMVAPGLVTAAMLPAMKVLPHRLLLPLISWLLAPRR